MTFFKILSIRSSSEDTNKERYPDDKFRFDRPNLKMNSREKIIGGDLLWRPTEAAKNSNFERF